MTQVTERALRLVALAMVFDIDSCDVEDCCQRHGLDYETSPVGDIRRAVLDDYGLAPLVPPKVVRAADE